LNDVKLGVVLPTREAAMTGRPKVEPLLEFAARAEDLGFDSVWAGDAPFARPRFEPLTLLAAVAARTRRVTVGTAILLPALRHPLLLAHAAATVDRVSEGRLVLGVGAGWVRHEFDALRVPFDQRVGRVLETMEICRRVWHTGGGDEPASFDGRYFSFHDIRLFPQPSRPEGPPFWLGGAAVAAAMRAGRRFDGWIPTSPDPEAFSESWKYVVRGAEEAGRDPGEITPAVYLSANLDPDNGEGESAEYAEKYYGLPFDVMRRAQAYFVGDVDRCAAWLRAFVEAGARHLVLRFASLHPATHLELAAGLAERLELSS
jgi:probable F420-dependent oxidoreductase